MYIVLDEQVDENLQMFENGYSAIPVKILFGSGMVPLFSVSVCNFYCSERLSSLRDGLAHGFKTNKVTEASVSFPCKRGLYRHLFAFLQTQVFQLLSLG